MLRNKLRITRVDERENNEDGFGRNQRTDVSLNVLDIPDLEQRGTCAGLEKCDLSLELNFYMSGKFVSFSKNRSKLL